MQKTKTARFLWLGLLVLALGVGGGLALQDSGINTPAWASSPGIEGTYVVVKRILPDGTEVKPPDILGAITFHRGYRNFNITWKEPQGNRISISYVARYRLMGDRYHETSVYFMVHDTANPKGPQYDFSGPSATAPVVREGGSISIQLPLYDEPKVIFEGDTLTAKGDGFVDIWKRVR